MAPVSNKPESALPPSSPQWEQLRAQALELARSMGGTHGATPGLLEDALKSAAPLGIDEALLQAISPRIEELEPLPQLILCLRLLRGLEGTALASQWKYRLAEVAVTALYTLGRLEFFPLRLTLLDGMLATEPPSENKADLLFRRGNTRAALAQSDPTFLDSAVQDLEAAAQLARSCGYTRMELEAECALARSDSLELPGRQPPSLEALSARIARLEALLPRAGAVGLAGEAHDVLAVLENRRIAHGHPGAAARAIQHSRQAVALARGPSVKATRGASLTELLLLHGTPQDVAAAVQVAQEAIQSLPADAGDIHAAQPHAALGNALRRNGRATEAIGHLEYALQVLARQAPSSNRNLIRIQLAQALVDAGRPDDARHHLELTFDEAYAISDEPGLFDAIRLLVMLDPRGGHTGATRESLLKGEARLAGKSAGTLLTLLRLSPEPQAQTLSSEFIEFVRSYLSGRLPTDETTDSNLAHVMANHFRQLPQDICQQLLTAGGRIIRDEAVRARLLHATGQRKEALDMLRGVLTRSQNAGERLGASALLITLLPEDAHEERLRWCDEVEKLLEGAQDNPYTRTDLASALWMSGRENKGLLERAWRHAAKATPQLHGNPVASEFNVRTRARIRVDQVSLHAKDFSPALRELASWFTQDLLLPGAEVSDYRCHVAWCLLITGPLTSPELLAVAGQVLELTPLVGKAQSLSHRLQWIRACLASPHAPPARPPSVPADVHSPWDELPGWAVALAQGEQPRRDGALSREERGVAFAVLEVRPDRAEAVLEWLFSLNSDGRELERLVEEVALSSPAASLERLVHTVEQLADTRPSYGILLLRVALRRRSVSGKDATAYTRAVDALFAFAKTPEERVQAKLSKGIERMDVARFDEARKILEEAAAEARHAQLSPWERFPVLLSTGNAFRRGQAPDIERALELYAEAESLGELKEQTTAQLCKVKADALLERDKEGDAVQALALLERALTLRKTGYLRVETLLSAAEAEEAQPGREPLPRLRRALDRLDEAERLAQGHYTLLVASALIRVLAQLVRLQPGDATLRQRLEQLGQRHPPLAKDVKLAVQGVTGVISEDVANSVSTFLAHPAGRAFFGAMGLLQTPDLGMAEQLAKKMGQDPAEVRRRLEQQLQKEDRSPRGLRAHADRLAQENDARARPGAAVGRAIVLARLAEWQHARPEEVEQAAHEADRLVQAIPEVEVRLKLRHELAHVWAPENHYNHPVRDFRRAAEVAREVRAACRPGSELARSALQSLARATRYRKDGDLEANLREAEQLYEQCAREYKAAGELDVAAHIRMNLAELRLERGAGDPVADLQDGIAAAREYLELGGPNDRRARAQVTLGVFLTMLGGKQPPARARPTLLEAREVFAKIDRSLLSASDLDSVDNYRTICLADLALQEGNPEEAILFWRQRRAALDPNAPAEVHAYTVHNLADMLMMHSTRPVEIMEGLELSERILEVRTLDHAPRHHWETCENIGRGVRRLLSSQNSAPLEPSFFRQVWEQGRRALRGALAAARRLGSHDRLARSAALLIELAQGAPSVAAIETTATEGWKALDEARPYLLLDEDSGEEEARLAAELAATLARRLAEHGLAGVSNGLECVLAEERAELVLRWMVRAAGASQRRLAGRTARPQGVPHTVWVEWLAAIRSGEARTIGRALKAIQQHEPLFLGGEPGLEGTERWLRARPGSVALAVVEDSRGFMAAVLTHDERRRVLIARVQAGPPPHDEGTVARSLSARGPGEEYLSLLEWARQRIIAPLAPVLPQAPSQLLWVPTGVLRVLSPADLWPSVPVTCAVRLDLETRAAPHRPRRTLLAVADPGPDSSQSIPGSIELGASLARTAQELGPLRVRMSRGGAWGQALGVPCPELVEGPASPDELLRELADVDVALLLCHGEVDGPSAARLLLMNKAGEVEPLQVHHLADDPSRVAGITIVLLSCETGRVGDWLHRAAGLAGVLLASGARNVIAPLWPVLLDPAWKVGNAVLQALASQGELSEALKHLHAPESGPALGRRVPAQGSQEQTWSLRAFVRWVG